MLPGYSHSRTIPAKTCIALLLTVFIITSCAGLFIHPDARYEFERGVSLFNRGNYREAIPHFRRATELEPEFSKAYLYLGRSYLNLGKWFEAIPPLRTAFRLSPEESQKEVINLLVDALFGVALHDMKRGNYKASISSFREILELSPYNTRAKGELTSTLITYAEILLTQGNIGDAINSYHEAMELSPQNINAYIGLARALFKNGEYMRALSTVKNALEIDPANSEVQSLMRELLRQ